MLYFNSTNGYNVLKFIFRFNSYCGDSKINKCIPGDVVILKLTTG